MNSLFSKNEKVQIEQLEHELRKSNTREAAEEIFQEYITLLNGAQKRYLNDHFEEEVPQMKTVDLLTEEEKEVIKKYEHSMHRAWTKRGVDRYYNKIMAILMEARER